MFVLSHKYQSAPLYLLDHTYYVLLFRSLLLPYPTTCTSLSSLSSASSILISNASTFASKPSILDLRSSEISFIKSNSPSSSCQPFPLHINKLRIHFPVYMHKWTYTLCIHSFLLLDSTWALPALPGLQPFGVLWPGQVSGFTGL